MSTQIKSFIKSLVHRAKQDDRRALAALRRGLGKPPGSAVEMMPYVVPYLPEKTYSHWAFFTTASLFGLHPDHRAGQRFGQVFRKVTDNESGERRFLALLASHSDELPEHLRRAVAMARQKGFSVDYEQLLRDMLSWTHPDRYVQLQWARQFWAVRNESKPTDNDKE